MIRSRWGDRQSLKVLNVLKNNFWLFGLKFKHNNDKNIKIIKDKSLEKRKE